MTRVPPSGKLTQGHVSKEKSPYQTLGSFVTVSKQISPERSITPKHFATEHGLINRNWWIQRSTRFTSTEHHDATSRCYRTQLGIRITILPTAGGCLRKLLWISCNIRLTSPRDLNPALPMAQRNPLCPVNPPGPLDPGC